MRLLLSCRRSSSQLVPRVCISTGCRPVAQPVTQPVARPVARPAHIQEGGYLQGVRGRQRQAGVDRDQQHLQGPAGRRGCHRPRAAQGKGRHVHAVHATWRRPRRARPRGSRLDGQRPRREPHRSGLGDVHVWRGVCGEGPEKDLGSTRGGDVHHRPGIDSCRPTGCSRARSC